MTTDLSIIIPALNEQAVINQAIEKLFDQPFPGTLEVIVVDGSTRCSTIDCVQRKEVIKINSPPGRGCQMNAGANAASGRILLFLHCDTALPLNAMTAVQKIMDNPTVGAGAFDLSIDGNGFLFRMIEKTASLRSRITKIPYGDQAVFIRKKYFFDIGQYREIPIMEDVDLMVRIKKKGGKLQFVNNCVVTSARRWKNEGILYCTIRNWIILTLYFLGVMPERLAGFYKNKSGPGH